MLIVQVYVNMFADFRLIVCTTVPAPSRTAALVIRGGIKEDTTDLIHILIYKKYDAPGASEIAYERDPVVGQQVNLKYPLLPPRGSAGGCPCGGSRLPPPAADMIMGGLTPPPQPSARCDFDCPPLPPWKQSPDKLHPAEVIGYNNLYSTL
jgi:hypothetical protein